MKILFTGASGMIGTALVRRLSTQGHEFVFLSQSPEKLTQSLGFPCEAFPWESSQSPPEEAFREIDAVIHLAGTSVSEGRWTKARKAQIRDSRVEGTRNLVRGLKRAGCRPNVFICASGVGYYGERGDQCLDEGATAGSDFLSGVVVDWEKEASAADCGRLVLMRLGAVLGRNGGMLEKLLPFFRFFLGGRMGAGHQWVSWIHLDDVVSSFETALSSSIEGPVNVVAPNPERNRDFSSILASSLKRFAILRFPGWVLKAIYGSKANLVLSGQFVQPTKLRALGFTFRFPTLDGALREIVSAQELVSDLWVPKRVGDVFPFFAEAQNLKQLTPGWVHFNIVNVSSPELREGTLLNYSLRVRGIPMKWQSKIEEYIPGQRFVDLQKKGPYALWQHTHYFFPYKGGTLIRDKILYRIPLGALGRMLLGKMVCRDLHRIFDFRKARVLSKFGELSHA
jgi:uncharacterized protein